MCHLSVLSHSVSTEFVCDSRSMTASILRVTTRIFRCYPHLVQFLRWLPHLDIPARKAILTLCCTQTDINKDSRASARLSVQLTRVHVYTTSTGLIESSTLHSILLPLVSMTTSSYFSGLGSMLTRIKRCVDVGSCLRMMLNSSRD